MTQILFISSYVASSRVGGSIAPVALAALNLDVVLAPTTLLGRHPGLGAPGGSGVPADQLASLLEGVEANGVFKNCRAVVTGYFSTPEQVACAANAIDKIHAIQKTNPPLILVDPIMGDAGSGLYIREDTARAIETQLVRRADIMTPNLWEFARLSRAQIETLNTPKAVKEAATALPCDVIVTSTPDGDNTGALYAPKNCEAFYVKAPKLEGDIPHGVGDLVTTLFAGRCATGETASSAFQHAVSSVHVLLEKAVTEHLGDLPLSRYPEHIASPPLLETAKL